MSEEHLSEAEKELFSQLEREKSPPFGLEQKILTQLKNEGLIKKTIIMKPYMKWAASIAAAIIIFFSGSYYGKSSIQLPIQIEPTMGYMLILHEDQDFQPGEPMAMFQEYNTWMNNTFARGVKITGQELKNEATVLKGSLVTNKGDEADFRTTGYFLLEASSYDDALAVAQDNPHIKYGGSVELKPFMVR